ncbi:Cullin family-domain-containing protein [Peziza echinospora]|nr:Cullin family-domain-containing protein [Peziza echinospora]
MPELGFLASPGSSQQNHSKKRKQSSPTPQRQQKQQQQQRTTQAASAQENYPPGTIRELLAASAAHTSSTPAAPTSPLSTASSSANKREVIDLTDSPPSVRMSGNSGMPAAGKATLASMRPRQQGPLNSPAGPRKLFVRNLRDTTVKKSPELYYEQTWKSLDTALTAIFNGEKITSSLEELYRGTENLCRADQAAPTYKKLEARCDAYVKGKLKSELSERAGRSEDEAVRAVVAAWTKWCDQLNDIRSIFFYLDRSYLHTSPTRMPILDTGLKLFGKHIASDTKIGPKFLKGIFNLFDQDRKSQGGVPNMSLLLSCIRILSQLGLYGDEFEPRFIAVSREYFAKVAEDESQKENLALYLAECANQLERESQRCDKFQLEISTKREIVAVLEDEMVSKRKPFLVAIASVGELVDNKDTTALTRLFSLLDRVGDAGADLKPAWEKYITAHGLTIVQDEQREGEMVPRLLEFKATLDNIWAGPFKKKEVLGYALRESFSTFINTRNPKSPHSNNSKPAEMIAKYVDMLLRTGVKGLNTATITSETVAEQVKAVANDEDAELAIQLENVLDLFRFIHGKDVFEAFYKKDLARRLLMGRSASADAERSMLSKLKTECGSGFTHNLESMFRDIDLSKDAMSGFKHSKIGIDKAKGIDLNVHILSSAAWPTYPETTVSLPEDLEEYVQAFEAFYTGKHKGRKLKWRHALGQCILKAHFPKGMKELVVSAFQAIVLLLFNDDALTGSNGLSYTAIKQATNLADGELIRTLQSLACGKKRVLEKHPKGKDVNPTDTFTFNAGFRDEKIRVKINQIQLKETKEENKETHERVAQDRQYETQAAIIRIMKSRKTIKHVELIRQTIEQTQNRGELEISEIKQNIEKLIDKEYMERVGDDTYNYVS